MRNEIRNEIYSKVYHFYQSPWDSADTKAELNFKRKLRDKNSRSYDLILTGAFTEIIELWKPLLRNPLFNMNHPLWLEKPFFRKDIQAGKVDLFFAYAHLAHAEGSRICFKKALSILEELLITPTYSLKGPSHDKLAPVEAAFQNEGLVIQVLWEILQVFIFTRL